MGVMELEKSERSETSCTNTIFYQHFAIMLSCVDMWKDPTESFENGCHGLVDAWMYLNLLGDMLDFNMSKFLFWFIAPLKN